MGVVDEARVIFLGDTTDLDQKTTKARADIDNLAKRPAVVVAPDPGPTISYWRNNTEVAKRSLAQISAEKAANDALDARLLKAQEERYAATVRQQAAEAYAANERAIQARSVAKHEEYLLDKAAEERITGTLETETNKRINRIRGLGPLFRATGLYQYGIDETTLNAGISVFNAATGRGAEGASKTSAAASAAKAAADTESAAATAAAATAETEKAAAATAGAVAETEGAAAAGVAAVEAEATAAAFLSMSVSMALVAPLLAVGAVLALEAYNLTRDIRSEEEHRLKLIEAANKGINDQLLYEKGITDELKKQRNEAAVSREVDTFKKDLSSRSLQDLQSRQAELEQVTKYAPTGDFDKKTGAFSSLTPDQAAARKKQTEELIALDDEIYKRQHTSDQSFNNIGDAHSKYLEDTRKDFDKEILETRKKITELSKAQSDTFAGLYERANGDNPFVRQMLQNAQAMEKFKDQARTLSPELQSIGYALIKQANDLAVYKAQIDSTFQALDLRDTASKFRDPTKKERELDFNRKLADQSQASNSTNPEVLYAISQERQRLDDFDQQQKQSQLDARLAVDKAARTPQQQAEADARTAAYASRLDPGSLRQDQRQDLADLFERQATRAEKRQDDALKIQQDQLKVWQDIQKNGLRLSNAAGTVGNQVLDITFKDESGNAKATVTPPTPQDTKAEYNFQGFDLVGGSNF